MEPAAPRRHDLMAVGILALLATILFADVLAGISNFYMRDLTRYYYPTKQILRDIVLGGEFPYWNPYFSAGQPIAANPEHEVFYPLTWLILLPSYDLGYRLHILIHLYIGLIGMYALLRSMELRVPAAFFGALTFGLGGIYLSYINLLPILFCAAWLPLTCLFVRRFLLAPSVRDFALASLFFGLQFLVGEPTTILQTGFILGMYALYRGWYAERRMAGMARGVGWIALITTAGLMVGAAQVLPALDHVRDSARSIGFEFSLVKAWSMPWAKYAELLFPNFLGHISVKRVMWYWGGGLYPGMGSPFLFSIYCGLLTVALVAGGIFARPRGGRLVILLFVASSLIALGGNTPLLRALYDAGLARSIRYPEKFILIALFALIVFAAMMLQRLLDGDQVVRDGALGFVAATTIFSAVIVVVGFTPLYARVFMKLWGLSPGGGATRMISISRDDWMIAAVRGILLLVLLATVHLRFRRTWLAAAALFVMADLALVVHELNPRMPRRFFTDRPAVTATLHPDRDAYRIFHESDWYGQEEIARKYFSTGEAVYWIVRNGLYPQTPVSWGVRMVLDRDYDKTALIPTIEFTDSIWDVKRAGRDAWYEPFMAMSNAWYRALYRDFEEERKKTGGDLKKATPIRFLEGAHHPRYYFADQLVTIKDRRDFVKKIVDATYSSGVAFVTSKTFVPAPGSVEVVRETANSATLDVRSEGKGFLVMSVTTHKYWSVTMDGRPVKPQITNITYQGIEVPPGRHRVEMRYANPIIQRSLLISGISTALLLILPAMWRRFQPARRVDPIPFTP
jgi:hypothetical protein